MSMSGLPLLTLTTFLPLAGVLFIAAIRPQDEAAILNIRRVALITTVATFLVSLGILAGFVPLTNLTSDFPCLNVHPADLTVTAPDGRRLLAGRPASRQVHIALGLTFVVMRGLNFATAFAVTAPAVPPATARLEIGPAPTVLGPIAVPSDVPPVRP